LFSGMGAAAIPEIQAGIGPMLPHRRHMPATLICS
jgi:hypothetical protein